MAQELKLPVILHCREAFEDLLPLLPDKVTGVLHCFTGGLFHLKTALSLGLFIGFDGNITYDHSLLGAVTQIPLEKLLLETDSPLLTPEPKRGERNEPKNLVYTAKYFAKNRNIPFAEFSDKIFLNSKTLFSI